MDRRGWIGCGIATLLVVTAGIASAMCGNGLLDNGETCANCPADCAVQPCAATTARHTVTVNASAPEEQHVAGFTIVVGYRGAVLSLPGQGADSSVRERVKNTPTEAIVAAYDRDYALRVVVSRSSAIPSGRLLTVDFDGCSGAAAPTTADVSCMVEGCANQFGAVVDCTCSITLP